MIRHPASGTLGTLQLLVFANAVSGEACYEAARELGFTQVKVENGNIAKATEYLAQHPSPEILLVEIGNQDEAPAQLDALADMVNPHTKVLATGATDSIRFLQWLSDLGIDGYLLQPFTAAEFKQALAKGAVKKATEGAVAPESKKLIAVVGTRGGVGTTTIATNLASIIATDLGAATALTDFDPYFGYAALALDLMPGRGLRDALEKPDRVDALFLERVMVKTADGVSVLSAEEPLAEVLNPQANAGEMVLAALREKFRFIIADLPRQMNPITRHILSKADHVILVAEPQVTALRDSLRYRDYLVETLKLPAPQVVLNRVGLSANNEIGVREFEKNYGHDVLASLPFVHEAIAAGAAGELLSTHPKANTLVSHLRTLARTLTGAEASEETEEGEGKASLVHRFLGKK